MYFILVRATARELSGHLATVCGRLSSLCPIAESRPGSSGRQSWSSGFSEPGKASQAGQAHQADRTGVQASQCQVRLAKQTRLIRQTELEFRLLRAR